MPLILIGAAAMLQIAGVRLPVVGRDWARPDPARCPTELLPALAEIHPSGPDGEPIFNDLALGGFLIYFEPQLRVFVDDRCSLYGADFLLDYDYARREYPVMLDRWRQQYGFRHALVEAGGEFDDYLSRAVGWILVERSPTAALYRHEHGANGLEERNCMRGQQPQTDGLRGI